MSQQLYRCMFLGGIVDWLIVDMSLSRLPAAFDAGRTAAMPDVLLLALFVIMGLLNAAALLRHPVRIHLGGNGASDS